MDGGNAEINPPFREVCLEGWTQWWLKGANGARRCLATGLMLLEVCIMDSNMGLSARVDGSRSIRKHTANGGLQDRRALEVCASDKQLQHKPVAPFQPAYVWWVEPIGLRQPAGSLNSARNKVARTRTFGEGTNGSCTEGGGASVADVQSKCGLRRRSYEQGSSVEQA